MCRFAVNEFTDWDLSSSVGMIERLFVRCIVATSTVSTSIHSGCCQPCGLFLTIFLYMTVPLIVGALLNATRGGDLQRSFIDGSAWSTCQCLLSIFLICKAQWLYSVEKKARLGVFVFGAFDRRSEREVLLAHCMAF